MLFIVRKRLVVMKGYVPACSSAAWSYVTWKKWRLLVLIVWKMSVLSCSYFYYPLRPECWFCCATHRKTEQYENKHVSCESPAPLLFECSSRVQKQYMRTINSKYIILVQFLFYAFYIICNMFPIIIKMWLTANSRPLKQANWHCQVS